MGQSGGATSTMDEERRKRLEAAGFKVGEAADFLGLSAEESDEVEERLALIAPAIESTDAGDTLEDRERDGWPPPTQAK